MQDNRGNYELQKTYYEDEIDLKDLIKVLYRNKLMIILVSVISVILGIGFALNIPKEYEVSADITVNQITSDKIRTNLVLYHNSKEFTEKLFKLYNLDEVYKDKVENINYNNRKEIIQNMISLSRNKEILGYSVSVVGRTAEETYEFMIIYLNEIEKYIGESIFTKLNQEEKVYSDDLVLTLEKIESYMNKIKNNQDDRIEIGDEIYSIELSELKSLSSSYERMQTLYRDVILLKKQIENTNIINVIDVDDIPEYPIKPNKKLIVLISGVLGMFVSIFLAFAKDFLKNFKLREFINEIENEK